VEILKWVIHCVDEGDFGSATHLSVKVIVPFDELDAAVNVLNAAVVVALQTH